jgi:hypothetical protein
MRPPKRLTALLLDAAAEAPDGAGVPNRVFSPTPGGSVTVSVG